MEPRRRFRFLKELSEGAFGKVYMAEMITGDNFRSIVAIKLLHGKWLAHEEIVQRSRDEARVLGLLHHRNIIRVEDLTAINGQCAIVMEFLDGVDLKNLINYTKERGDRIPRKVAFEIIAAASSALEAAYNQAPLQGGEPLHLIHRDIKPSNVMVTKAGDVKVLDFGTAQAKFDEREAHTQALAFGSAAYMAPERLLGDPDAPSGDVFSLGVTLYELLAQKSFGKVHIRPEKYEAAVTERLDGLDLADLGPERSGQVRQVMRLMLSYESDDRPTARQVVELMEALADEVHDGSMRRFAREVVAPCRELLEPVPNNEDPLTGSTLFEDRTGSTDSEGMDSGAYERVLAEADSPPVAEDANPFQVPPELQADDDELIDDEDATAPPEAAVSVGLGMSMPGPSIAPLRDPDSEPHKPVDSGFTVPPMSPPEDYEDAATVFQPSPELAEPSADPAAASGVTSGATATAGRGAPPPPAVRTVAPVASPAASPAASPVVARQSTPRDDAPAAKKSGGGKLVVGLVAMLVVVAIVVGGGLFAAVSMGLIGGEGGGATPAADGGPEASGSVGVPGGTIEVGEMDGTNGALSLALQPPGKAEVSISSVTGFKQDWDGTGRLILQGLSPGTYKTKVSPAEGSTIRSTLEVVSGQTCSYVLPVDGSTSEWKASGCE